MPPTATLNAPAIEHLRSPSALRTAELAAESGLFLAHFEHRALLPWPAHLCPAHLPELAEPAVWQRGQLAEHKFQSFRHDRMVGSFHPGHRAKWTAHELCHLLVGFAYAPGKSRYFHALSAWLAELLPVTLYYFFDEAGLSRCADHAGDGPLFGRACARCEHAAHAGARPLSDEDRVWIRKGREYLEAELAALARSRRTGLPRGHHHATLDLCSDAIAYAAAHGRRLDSELFERFASQFFEPGQGLHDSLDALEERVLDACAALLHEGALPPWRAQPGAHLETSDRASPSPATGPGASANRGDRGDCEMHSSVWKAQDLGYRLLLVHSETEGEAADALDAVIDALAHNRTEAGLEAAADAYIQLSAEYVLPEAHQVLGTGYPLPRGGSCVPQLADGIASACPNTFAALEDPDAVVARFAAADAPERIPLGRRFAAFLAARAPGALADLARYEAALSHAQPPSLALEGLDVAEPDREPVRLGDGVELVRLDHDVLDGDVTEAEQRREPVFVAVRATAERDLSVAELPAGLAEQLLRGPLEDPSRWLAELTELASLGFVVPARYREA